ncbi:uncharacterized protein A4U43_C09F1780 [Asparagus officinalis]|uniref:Alginate lyase 2 domain-containing protein n=1 Tax=Asparagus officinalis TaxID=4686 RepID=A0A5P1E6E4_ASPOF|nr:citrate-binding protein-like [Asparagus officinalis]ONK57563.1 uncharacterized protein A4U43_C09F1780 [Asparagus officinalis]
MGPFAWFLLAFLFPLTLVKDVNLLCHGDLTDGFIPVPLNESNYHKLWPYNLPLSDCYSFTDGVRKLWVYSTDKSHSHSSTTKPRTEISISLIDDGYTYASGMWQFERQAYVPNGTSGVCIMQIFCSPNADGGATTLMLRVYDGALKYYQQQTVEDNIYDQWFKVNVIHDTAAKVVKVFINSALKLTVNNRGGSIHSFKFGVYTQNNSSCYMESCWKGIKVLKFV